MGASIKRIRDNWDVKPTRDNKGLTLTLKLIVYDNDLFQLDGVPLNDSRKGHDREQGWVVSNMVIGETVEEFRKEVRKRRGE